MSGRAGSEHPTGYDRPDQMWSAVTDRIKNTDPTAVSQRQRQFLYDRLLARVFTHAPEDWVLKGGTALLARVRDARHSRDVDLNRTAGTLETAVQELRVAAATDLDDHVRFVTEPHHRKNPGQGNARLQITPYIGVRPIHSFGVDVVVSTLLTAEPDLHQVTPVVDLPGIAHPPYRLYPVVDHVADKVCATMELHAGQPSTRHRDLLDLVVIACTQTVNSVPLTHAVESERRHRALPPITAWSTPPQWAIPYGKDAPHTAHCAEYPRYADGTGLVARFLDPIFSGELDPATWDPDKRIWEPTRPLEDF